MAQNVKSTQLRLPPDIFDKLKFIAATNRRSFNAQIEVLADNCIREFEEMNGTIDLDSLDPDLRFRSSPRNP